ncbi:response regulator [Paenibacillus sp. J22TS3]|uniref:response regulator n=1 Tax=Paenibacillus sp. J22TS3 TaxID=2807192 RepID=UPI001B26E01F|nr:response regulator [Paenibacillus sp. J22TS3]GIP20633.1 DNA-binding response regulator [Paenibacillus sp. J22TS3]
MKKVFLVDDEILVREGIRDRIDWESEGFVFSGDAPDGEMALPLIERIAPDIVVTDIKMPFMDGIQLSKILKERMPAVKIIILSGHDEFTYAREALRIGVEEYCLKPLSSAELLTSLHRVSYKIDSERRDKRKLEELQLRASVNIDFMREQMLIDLCTGSIPTADAIQMAEEFGIPLISGFYLVTLLEFEAKHEEDSSSIFNIEHDPLFQSISLEYSDHLHVKRNKKQHAWILKGDNPAQLESLAEKLIRDIKQLEEKLSCTIYTGIGSVKSRVQEISISFSEADQKKSYQHFLRKRPINSKELQGIISYKRSKLNDFLEGGDSSKIEEFVLSYMQDEGHSHNTLYSHYMIMDMIISATQFIHESGGDVNAFISELESVEESLQELFSLEEMRRTASFILRLVFQYRDRIKNKYSDIISKAKDYIDNHFDNPDISLQSVAAYVNVSPNHFSSIFSNAVGQTFIDYLIRTRIKRAMKLLKTTSAKSYEIATMVGYNDPHYFNSVFKKITGVTTKVYRNQEARICL